MGSGRSGERAGAVGVRRAAGWVAVAALAAVAAVAAFTVLKKPAAHPAVAASPPGQLPAAAAIPSPATTVNPAVAPSMPAHGAYVGAYIQPSQYSESAKVAAMQAFQRAAGRRLDIVHSYLKWQVPFPTPAQQAILDQGSTLLLSWAGDDTRVIASGADDAWIRRQARAIKAAGKPIFLEWRWEMNRPGLHSTVHSPAAYVAAWDHIRSIFTQQRVRNVAWVWCPSIRGFGNVPGYLSAPPYYPGNNEVDWVCADAYPTGYNSFASIIQPFLAWAAHVAKPVMIGEFGVPRSYGPQRRAAWLAAAAQTVRADPQVKAVVYFDGDPPGAIYSRQYGLNPGSAPMAAFRRLTGETYFNPDRLPVAGRPG